MSALLDLAKQWHADDCEVYDRTRLAKILRNLTTLIEVLGEGEMAPQLEAVQARADYVRRSLPGGGISR